MQWKNEEPAILGQTVEPDSLDILEAPSRHCSYQKPCDVLKSLSGRGLAGGVSLPSGMSYRASKLSLKPFSYLYHPDLYGWPCCIQAEEKAN